MVGSRLYHKFSKLDIKRSLKLVASKLGFVSANLYSVRLCCPNLNIVYRFYWKSQGMRNVKQATRQGLSILHKAYGLML